MRVIIHGLHSLVTGVTGNARPIARRVVKSLPVAEGILGVI